MAVVAKRALVGMPVTVIIGAKISRMSFGIIAAPERAIDVAREAVGIAAFEIVT